MPVVDIVESMLRLISLNVIAKTDLMADATSGTIIVNVANSFRFNAGDEIVIIDNGYNDPASSHYQRFEYARVKKIIDTFLIELYSPILSNWLVSEKSFIQKTIGHSPLYDNRLYYGDRDVIPSEDMSITVEPISLSNEWIYIQGGLSEEYRVSIMIYGKDIETEQGMKILNKYADCVYALFMKNIHIGIKDYDTPLYEDSLAGTNTAVVLDTLENRENIVLSATINDPSRRVYDVQDNLGLDCDLQVIGISPAIYNPGGLMTITFDRNFSKDHLISEFGALIRQHRYIYDSRIDNVEYGTVQKGSAFIRAARLNWFGKEIEEYVFPQVNYGINNFENITWTSSSSSSMDSSSSSSQSW